jgi:NAD(P)H-hydrate epimerase
MTKNLACALWTLGVGRSLVIDAWSLVLGLDLFATTMKIITDIPNLPPRPIDGHKGTFGRVLVVGGSADMMGAPVLAATAALRMGAGLVQIAVPRQNLSAALTITPELVGLGLSGVADDRKLMQAADLADALVIGPGRGTARDAARRFAKLITLAKPGVVDADALNLLALRKKWPTTFKLRAVLTPHPGEMGRLARLFGRDHVPVDDAGRAEIASAAARAFGQIIVLKGHETVVTDGRRVYVNRTGDSTLAKAGSGDVLSGMIGCLLGQGLGAMDAAILGTYMHGRAGELAGQRFGQRFALARDVIDAIGEAAR